ncbi:sulfur-oxidizing protein SoxY [Azospirillum lipoferum]|uniref:Quinoprotein dehydrogenase-associated SoxYZ-like carrier n=1 Tax=Azospirillum lipoferum TaxID=193 RepID=A0A5A9GDV0_AZOLI|nr:MULTISPECIES: quinoprotein dehydrogenase-associated SoxYZ-like carrier [Azospirillum]KAA0592630.1 quinoprotein dehydrogenase-associated SoxYZ-like carrier [Azospirillum lipoferum]MCP1614374.1 sulfur-oxidizing protein SoxY [Azospirillum lipoferum]MDW5532794.1 quinoprotein dehydrogenase-associated SoxYZ-like carrier [Azospirillum sp. NL1]
MRYAWRQMGLTGAMLVIAGPGFAASSPSDPLNSVMWEVLRDQYFAGAPVVFDDAVKVTAPAAAEDTRAVPLSVDATALGRVVEMVAIADLNPFPLVLRYHPGTAAPYIATRIKIQQATAVRGAARTADGVWHVSGVMVDAAGGGCSAPPASYAQKDWADHVGEVQARLWPAAEDGVARLRLRIRHPNDTGLVDGIPAYFVETLQVDAQTPGGSPTLARIDSLEPVSENPVYSLDLRPPPDATALILRGRDNQGGEIRATIPMPPPGAKPAMSLKPAGQSWSVGQ